MTWGDNVTTPLEFIHSRKSQTSLNRMKSTTTSHESRKCHNNKKGMM